MKPRLDVFRINWDPSGPEDDIPDLWCDQCGAKLCPIAPGATLHTLVKFASEHVCERLARDYGMEWPVK